MDLICITIEFLVMLILFKAGSIRDKMDKIESVLEDINNKLGENKED